MFEKTLSIEITNQDFAVEAAHDLTVTDLKNRAS